jgi:hypothetical protein
MDVMSVSLMIKEIGAEAVKDALDRLGVSARDVTQDLARVDSGNEKVAASANRVAKAAKDTGNEFGVLGRVFGNVKDELAGLVAGFGAVMIVQKFIAETSSATIAQAQLAAVLRSTAGASQQTIDSLNAHSAALARLTAFEDDAITSAQVLLLSFNKIQGDTFPKATRAVLDLATLLAAGTSGQPDLKGAAMQVGKALQDPILGVSALSRAGVQFSESQREMIKGLVESNRLLDAQQVILDELTVQTAGQAEAMRNTFGGAVQGLLNDVNNLFELSDTNAANAAESINTLAAALRGLTAMLADSRLSNGLSRVIDLMSKAVALMPMVQVLRGAIGKAVEAGGGVPQAPTPPPNLRPAGGASPGAGMAAPQTFGSDEEFDRWFESYQEKKRIIARDAMEARNIGNVSIMDRILPSMKMSLSEGALASMRAQVRQSVNIIGNIVNTELADKFRGIGEQLGQVLSAGVSNAFQALTAKGGNITDAFKALGQTVLSGLGDMLIQVGTKALAAAIAVNTMLATLFSPTGIAAALAVIALGGALKGVASRMVTTGQGAPVSAGGFGYTGMGGGGGITLPGVTYLPTAAGGMGSRVMAATPMQVTIIGPNDPTAQRQMQELIQNANRRGQTRAV